MLRWGLGSSTLIVAGGAAGLELVAHGVLPGNHLLEIVDGACSVATPRESFGREGPSYTAEFYSHARQRRVSYTLAYPPGHDKGSQLPLVLALHPWGGDHASSFGGLPLAKALALAPGGRALTPMAMLAPDGGKGYWHAHHGDDPMGMIVNELIPRCRQLGLGRSPRSVGVTGVSMGGYGALLLAEKEPELVRAVAAVSPAIWTSWAQARAANPNAYASAADFEANDVVRHTSALAGMPVRVASGTLDPFHPGVVALTRALPTGATIDIAPGCHTGPFFDAQAPPSMEFLSAHLAR